jgi:hypothetical protein
MFQIIRLMLDDNGDIIARRPQPLFELRDHAMAIARNEASGLWGGFGFDEARQCWWATDAKDRQYHFVVKEIVACAKLRSIYSCM